MITTTTETIAGRTITETLGLVTGNTIQSKHIGRDIAAGLKGIVGGELRGYTEMTSVARDEALARMITEATALGADAVVGVRFSTAMVMTGAAEMLAYGTAVKLS